jgi:hypothetical protein
MVLLMTAIEFPLLRTAVEMVKPGVVECFLVDAEAPSHSGGSTSFVSLFSLCLIDNQKQNQHASLVKYCCTPFQLHTLLATTDHYAAQLNLGKALSGSNTLILGFDGQASRRVGRVFSRILDANTPVIL